MVLPRLLNFLSTESKLLLNLTLTARMLPLRPLLKPLTQPFRLTLTRMKPQVLLPTLTCLPLLQTTLLPTLRNPLLAHQPMQPSKLMLMQTKLQVLLLTLICLRLLQTTLPPMLLNQLLARLLTQPFRLTLTQMKLRVLLPTLICLRLLQTTLQLTLLNQLLVQLPMLLLLLMMRFRIQSVQL